MTLLLLLCLGILGVTFSQQNSQEEAICRPFLTSRMTSPLVPNLRRNLTIDEDGEFACELVLQDLQLPMQIRATIHEGLGWLAIRHCQMGLLRQSTVTRHFGILADIAPSQINFALKAGTFLLDPVVADAEKAKKYLHNAVYGEASQDSTKTAEQAYIARNLYAKALGRLQEYKLAQIELERLLTEYPYDFEALAALQQHAPSADQTAKFISTLATYETIAELGTSNYAGFIPPLFGNTVETDTTGEVKAAAVEESTDAWQPQIFTRLLSAEEFADFTQRREPFIMRLGSAKLLSQALEWNTQAWRGEAGKVYLKEKVGSEDDSVLVEARPNPAALAGEGEGESLNKGNENFGFGLHTYRKFMPFTDLLQNDFLNAAGNESVYLNIQQPSPTVYRPPLHRLQEDIPLPAMLSPIQGNLTEVNLWMGYARNQDAQSKLHMDATDNLYVVLEGSKHFAIASPADALQARTVAPTYAVSPDGLSFQFNVRKFAAYARHIAAQRAASAVNTTSSTTTSTTTATELGLAEHPLLNPPSIQRHLIEQEIEYEVSNLHFSTLDATTVTADTVSPRFTHFDLQEGDALYLPTGWFHQVTSRQGRHMAINYWWRALNWRDAVEFEREQSQSLYDKLLGLHTGI